MLSSDLCRFGGLSENVAVRVKQHRDVHVSNDAPTPQWPEEDRGRRCACGAELEFLTIVHQPIPDDRPGPQVVHETR